MVLQGLREPELFSLKKRRLRGFLSICINICSEAVKKTSQVLLSAAQ